MSASRTPRLLLVATAILAIYAIAAPERSVAENVEPLALEDALRFRKFADLAPMAISPDRKWLAFSIRDNQRARTVDDKAWALTGVRDIFTGTDIYVLNLESGAMTNVTGGMHDNFQTVWSPDSQYLAFISDRDGSNQAKLWLWDTLRDKVRKVSDLSVRQLGLIEWTSDSRRIIAPVLPEGMSPESYSQELRSGSQQRNDDTNQTPGSTVTVFRSNADSAKRSLSEASGPWSLRLFMRDLAVINIADGKTTILVHGRVAGYSISPDGSRIAYSIPKRFENPGSQQTLFDLFTATLDGVRKQLLVADARLDYDGASFTWSPDSKRLAYYAFREHGLETDTADYYLVGAEGANLRDVTESVPQQTVPAKSTTPLWDATGEHIYFIRNGALWMAGDRMDARQVAIVHGRQILKLISHSQTSVWTSQPGSIVVVTRDPHNKQDGFYRVELTTGQSTKLLEQGQCYACVNMDQQFEVTSDGKNMVYFAEDAQHDTDLWLSDSTFSVPRRLTHLNPQFDNYKMGSPRLVSWLSDDGEPLHGALLLPSSYTEGKRYPLVVWVYGGTNRSDRFDHFGFEGQGPFNLQLLATRGYAVLLPDAPQHLGTPMLDLLKTVMPGVNRVIEMGIADPERLGVMGHSYGGYSTLCLITQTRRFRAALESGGEADLVSGYGEMDDRGAAYGIANDEEGQGEMGATPWQYRDRYIENSPIFYLDRVDTPLLIIHGSEDTAIRPFLGDEVFVDLRRLGKEVEYAKYADEEHSPLGWSYANQLDFCSRMIAWFNSHLTAGDHSRKTPK